jgi:hypothetical protein
MNPPSILNRLNPLGRPTCPRCRRPIAPLRSPRRRMPRWGRPSQIVNMAAGDRMYDTTGNPMYDATGNPLYSNGAGDSCCCVSSDCNPCHTGNLPASLTFTLIGTSICTGCLQASLVSAGNEISTSWTVDGTYSLAFSAPGTCTWKTPFLLAAPTVSTYQINSGGFCVSSVVANYPLYLAIVASVTGTLPHVVWTINCATYTSPTFSAGFVHVFGANSVPDNGLACGSAGALTIVNSNPIDCSHTPANGTVFTTTNATGILSR